MTGFCEKDVNNDALQQRHNVMKSTHKILKSAFIFLILAAIVTPAEAQTNGSGSIRIDGPWQIPDVGNGQVTQCISEGSLGLPANATITNATFSLQISPLPSGAGFFAGDYKVVVLREDGTGVPDILYDRDGSRTDNGTDDDPEDDADLFFDQRSSIVLNGAPSGACVEVSDHAANDFGQLDYFQVDIQYTVPNANQGPTANDEGVSTSKNTPITIDVLANDSDPDGDPLLVFIGNGPTHGSVVVNADQTVTYTPDAGFVGNDSFEYSAVDPGTLFDTATVGIIVVDPNNAPNAVDDIVVAQEGESIVISPLDNDTDPDGDALQFDIIVDPPDNGGVTVQNFPANTVVYTPNLFFHGLDNFTYRIKDANGATAEASVNITVNAFPRVNDDAATTAAGQAVTIDVLSNDSDPDPFDALQVFISAHPNNGTAAVNNDMTVTYTPNAGFTGQDDFVYGANDGNGATAYATATITVSAANQVPVANNDQADTLPGQAVTINVLANDSDPDGDPLSVFVASQPTNGTAVANNDNTITYTPNSGFVGGDSFLYGLADNHASVDATVDITVNTPPVAANDNATTTKGNAVTIDILANDNDADGHALVVFEVGNPSSGTTSLNADQKVIYTPNAGFSGSDSFTYKVRDQESAVSSATVSVTVTNPNSVPTASDDNASTAFQTAIIIDVVANDSDADGDALTVTRIVSGPGNGSTNIESSKTIKYTPNNGFTGSDTFTYEISDGQATATAQVNVSVGSAPNQAPVAQNDNATTAFQTPVQVDVLANDSDPDGNTLTVAAITQQPSSGTAQIANNKVTYTPNTGFSGQDVFNYQISDGQATAEATVTITVSSAPNQAPVAQADSASVMAGASVTLNVLANDNDADGDALTVLGIVSAPLNGTATLNNDQTITYTANAGFVGTDQFTYEISDGQVKATANVTLIVAMATANEDGTAPEGFFLGQNYPNPFNPATNIAYQLAQATHVYLAVYDVRGRMVAELMNGLLPAGSHTATFEAGSLPSGLYLYRLKAGDFVETRQMMLLK